jgi:hypothetical protein
VAADEPGGPGHEDGLFRCGGRHVRRACEADTLPAGVALSRRSVRFPASRVAATASGRIAELGSRISRSIRTALHQCTAREIRSSRPVFPFGRALARSTRGVPPLLRRQSRRSPPPLLRRDCAPASVSHRCHFDGGALATVPATTIGPPPRPAVFPIETGSLAV